MVVAIKRWSLADSILLIIKIHLIFKEFFRLLNSRLNQVFKFSSFESFIIKLS